MHPPCCCASRSRRSRQGWRNTQAGRPYPAPSEPYSTTASRRKKKMGFSSGSMISSHQSRSLNRAPRSSGRVAGDAARIIELPQCMVPRSATGDDRCRAVQGGVLGSTEANGPDSGCADGQATYADPSPAAVAAVPRHCNHG